MTNFQLMNLIFRNLLYSDELKTWMDGVKNGFNSKSGDRCDCMAIPPAIPHVDCHMCNPGCPEENSPTCIRFRRRTCICKALWCPCQVGCSEFGSDRCEKICALFPDKCLPSIMPF